MKISVIIPVHNSWVYLMECLEGLRQSQRHPDTVIVVDDGSTEHVSLPSTPFDCRLLTLPGGPRGPAFARNRGVQASNGDVLVFFDSDVVPHPDTLGRIEQQLFDEPTCDALFGSYDDTPTEPGLASQYKNLIHHYVHQSGDREASSFWAGCGAIRRQAFEAVGGFSECFSQPSIEDIELGLRLRNAGRRICLCPDIQVKHLKRWTLRSVWMTDIFKRALPWSRLLVNRRDHLGYLNIDRHSQCTALIAITSVAFAVIAIFLPWLWLAVFASLLVFILFQRNVIGFFYRRRGTRFMIGASAMHLIYFQYSTVVYLYAKFERMLYGDIHSKGADKKTMAA